MLNKVTFGLIHRFSSLTYRRLGMDNYTWSAAFFAGAAYASVYLARNAIQLGLGEETSIAEMRERSAYLGLVFFIGMAVLVLYFRKEVRKEATRYYDMGNKINPWISVFPWLSVIFYFVTLPFMYWPGVLDVLLVGIGLMFLFAEPPPMEERVDKEFKKAINRRVH